ncbi:hypothetical protein [Sphingobacterium sp. BS-2]|uniref:hypothetical protein n=1 Tax=Sphingobacterium sp. BS-2 TaxID=3377129 RepID=UPI0038FCCAF4
MDRRLNIIEEKLEDKDYSAALAEISQELDSNIKEETFAGLKTAILKYSKVSDNLVAAFGEQRTLIRELPKKIQVGVEHRITGNPKPYIITGLVLLLISFFSLFANFQLWRSNSALQDGDIKIRMMRLFYPPVSLDIDSIYNSNPKELKLWVKQEEERLLAIIKAEENGKQSTEQQNTRKKNWKGREKLKNRNWSRTVWHKHSGI